MIKNDCYDQRMTTLGSLFGKSITVSMSNVDPKLFNLLTGGGDDSALIAEICSLIAAAAPDMQFGATAIQAALYQDDDAHDTCTLTACLNPLHPGPCKGWKGTLHEVSPGAWHAIEAARVEKANKRRVAKIEALKAQGKPIPHKLLTPIIAKPHPNAGKTAGNAAGQAHAAGKAISDAAGVHVSEPGKVTLGQAVKAMGSVEKGPKGKKPTLGSKGIAFVIGQEKVTPQYKLDKAATITPEQWAGLSEAEQSAIHGELAKIQSDGFGPQQKKATELMAKLVVGQQPNTGKPELKPGAPGTITTPSGKVYQKISPKQASSDKPKTIAEAKADGTLAKAAADVAKKATPPTVKEGTEPADASSAGQAKAIGAIADAVFGKQSITHAQLTKNIDSMKSGGKAIDEHPGFKTLVNQLAQAALKKAHADKMPGIGHGDADINITTINHAIRDHIKEGKPGLPDVVAKVADHHEATKNGTVKSKIEQAAEDAAKAKVVEAHKAAPPKVKAATEPTKLSQVATPKPPTADLAHKMTGVNVGKLIHKNGGSVDLVVGGKTVEVGFEGGGHEAKLTFVPALGTGGGGYNVTLKDGTVHHYGKGEPLTLGPKASKKVHDDLTAPVKPDAVKASPPKADIEGLKTEKAKAKLAEVLDKHKAPQETAAPKPVPEHLKHAVAMANGYAPGATWSKNHLAAYEKLSAEEFHSLHPGTQEKIVAELKKGETKFLDPKKVQATKDLLAKFGKGPSTPSTPKATVTPKAVEDISFGKHFNDHSVTQAQAKQVVAQTGPTTVNLAAKKVLNLPPAEDPDNPDHKKAAEDGAKSLIGFQTKLYAPAVLDSPQVKAAVAHSQQVMTAEMHARMVADAKKKAFNKVTLKLQEGDKLSPIQTAALKQYQAHLLNHPVASDTADLDKLNAETKQAKDALDAALHAALKDANAPKPEDMSDAQLDSKVKELLGSDVVDPTKPHVSPSLAEMSYAKKMATSEVNADAAKYPAAVLSDPAVAAKHGAYINAVTQLNAAEVSEQALASHFKNLHEATLLSGEDVHGNPLSKEDKQIIGLHSVKLAKEYQTQASPAAVQAAQDKAKEAKDQFHAAAEKAAAPHEPVTLSTYDQFAIGDAFTNAWFKHASKAVTYGVDYSTSQKMKAHPEYPALTQDLGKLKVMAGEVAIAHAEEHTAKLNAPTDPDTGNILTGTPEAAKWVAAMNKRADLEQEFGKIHKQAQARLDKIRTDAGLKKRALPKLDAAAVKATAAESGYYKSSYYSGGPNYGKQAAAKSYMLAKVGDKLGVKHQSAAEKKAEKLGAVAAKTTSTGKIENVPSAPVTLGGGDTIAHIPDPLKKQITSDFKGMPSGKYLADPAEDIFGNLVNLAAAHGKTIPGGLSVDQVLKTIDETHSKNLGVANSGMLHKKVTDWLGTGAGKTYAETHSTPDAKVVKQLNGEITLPKGVTLAPGEKVQKVAGPGAHDESLPHEAFKKSSSVSAQVAQDQYMKDQGIKWSADQKKALKSYTGSSYHSYNGYLRGTASSLSPEMKENILLIQSAMMPLPQHTLLRRGTGWDALPAEFHGDNASKLIGKTIEEPGFTSTTVAGESGHFGGPLQLEIEAPIGTAAAFVNGISHYKNQENEMLLAAGTKFKVLSVTKKGYQTVMRVRIVGDK